MKELPCSKVPAYARVLIQRLQMVSKDNQVRFGERFLGDYMGGSEFERGYMAARLRELHEDIRLAVVKVADRTVYVAYHPKHFANDEEVRLYIEDLYYQRISVKEHTDFKAEYVDETLALQREYKKSENKLKRKPARTNAWFDIERGVFWTLEKINLKDIPLNIRKSVEYMDAIKREESTKE